MITDFTFRKSAEFCCELIVSSKAPFEVFRAYKFENGVSLENFIKKYNLLNDCVTIDNYNILICYMGTTAQFSNAPILGHNVPGAAKEKFIDLKKFYEKERIKGNETRQKKFARK